MKNNKLNESVLIILLLMMGYLFIVVASVIFSYILDTNIFDKYNVLDGILYLIMGYSLIIIGIELLTIRKNRKWYEKKNKCYILFSKYINFGR